MSLPHQRLRGTNDGRGHRYCQHMCQQPHAHSERRGQQRSHRRPARGLRRPSPVTYHTSQFPSSNCTNGYSWIHEAETPGTLPRHAERLPFASTYAHSQREHAHQHGSSRHTSPRGGSAQDTSKIQGTDRHRRGRPHQQERYNVDAPTRWVSPAFFVPKPDGVRMRLVTDYTKLNKYVQRPIHPFPSTRDIMQSIPHGQKLFAQLDAVHGYFQLALDEESSYLTTFLLPQGRFRYLLSLIHISEPTRPY